MKVFILAMLSVVALHSSNAQSFPSLDKSPMDVAYLPDNYAHDRKPGQNAIVKIHYSRPQKKGRKVFGGMVPYGKVWRTGANEANELKVYQEVTMGGEKVGEGTYSLFTIPGKKEWIIILNSEVDYWGAYSYQEANDVVRFKAPVKTLPEVVEAFSIRLEETGSNQAVMRMAWDQTLVEIPITY